ncbi:MAG: hypothetical protein R2879_21470, partial [Saprospiraceae bacterium]
MKNLVVSLAVLFLYSCGPKENSSATTAVPNSNTSGSSYQVPPAENPDISFKVDGYNGTGLVQLVGIFEGQNYLVDSARIQNGSFQFKKNTPYQQGLLFAVFPDNQNVQFL